MRRGNKDQLPVERGTIKKSTGIRYRVALVYPNHYPVGMSNLGFQTVYRLFNEIEGVACERAFLPDLKNRSVQGVKTVESRASIKAFDLIAFSISYENDASAVLTLLEAAGLPLSAARRGTHFPLVLAGGVFCFLNPEPLSPFIDAFLLGEAEVLIPGFSRLFDPKADKATNLMNLARRLPGCYVPAFYLPRYHKDGTLAAFEPVEDVPEKIQRTAVPDLSDVPTASTILTPQTTFPDTYLVEVSRGCPHGCRFCGAGYVYRPPRFRPVELLHRQVEEGSSLTDRIGLVGAAVSDLPGIHELCARGSEDNLRFSFSSLRADAMDGPLVDALQKSNVKTATIAPDAGSERMRRVINKGVDEEQVIHATATLVAAGIPNLKVYFMVGLPTETESDVYAIVDLVKRIKQTFLSASRGKGRMGEITVSLSSFVPKPFTPFQWAAMDTIATLKWKRKAVQAGLKKTANVRVHADIPRWAYLQGIIARGDRRVADLLVGAHRNRGNWPRTLKESSLDPAFYVHRQRGAYEMFPWDFIDQGIEKNYLFNEYQRALEEKISPPCPADPSRCSLCGVCEGK